METGNRNTDDDNQISATLPIVIVVAAVLDRLVLTTDSAHVATITKFSAQTRPEISLQNYLLRFLNFTKCSRSSFIIMLIYIDRLIQRDRFVLGFMNVHRVIVATMVIAAKFFDDEVSRVNKTLVLFVCAK